MGGGDEVPDAIRRMGIDVTMLDADMLATGDLSKFDTIDRHPRLGDAAGLRRQQRPAAAIRRARRHADRPASAGRAHRPEPGPYPVSQKGNPRITDETAPVTILAPTHPLFTFQTASRLRISTGGCRSGICMRSPISTGDIRRSSRRQTQGNHHSGAAIRRGGQGPLCLHRLRLVPAITCGRAGAYRQFANLISLSKAAR